jgi:cyclomaltodextrinase / maltogenic alpha-amylase / neopullulanase
MKKTIKDRVSDWRYGAVVYQVMVDRFALSKDLESKKHLYEFPRTLVPWDTLPKSKPFSIEKKYHEHELEFWGGDLSSLKDKLDYIASLNVDVLYLNPIPEAVSNHKYDASDYLKVSSEYGDLKDLYSLIEAVHSKHMKIMLDGVFNHIGVASPMFIDAKNNLNSKYRHYFDFNDDYSSGVRLWMNVPSLPELNLEHQDVQNYIYKSKDSVIQSYLHMGVDGWRLDVAFDIGYKYLSEITSYSHVVNPNSCIIGEIPNYPNRWAQSMDGVMNFTFRELIIKLLLNQTSPYMISIMFEKVIKDTTIEKILTSWTVIDNHDVPRLTHTFKTESTRKLAILLLFTLPGSPNVYYGTELGMEGGTDPENRAPMAWHLNHDHNQTKQFVIKLIQMRQTQYALKVGDFKRLVCEKVFAFVRVGDAIMDDVYVIMNVLDQPISDIILIDDSNVMNYASYDILEGYAMHMHVSAGVMEIKLEPYGYVVFKIHTKSKDGYTSYKRI